MIPIAASFNLAYVETFYAYIGPGLGLEAIGFALGLITSCLVAIFTIIWYPLRKFFSLFKKKKKTEGNP